MKPIALLLTALLLAAGDGTAQSLAFTDVTVIDIAAGVIKPGMTVVVVGDRIAAAGVVEDVEVPSGATVGGGELRADPQVTSRRRVVGEGDRVQYHLFCRGDRSRSTSDAGRGTRRRAAHRRRVLPAAPGWNPSSRKITPDCK